jgi:hypothetical protein
MASIIQYRLDISQVRLHFAFGLQHGPFDLLLGTAYQRTCLALHLAHDIFSTALDLIFVHEIS